MPLRHPNTIDRAKVLENIQALKHAGWPERVAILDAFNAARAAYFRRFPEGLLPLWMAFPKNRRSARYYTVKGERLDTNPKPTRKDVSRAKKLAEGFNEAPLDEAQTFNLPDFNVGIAPGRILGIIYAPTIAGQPKKLIHWFRTVKSRPLLVVSHDGKQFRSLGGAFRFTDRGFVDGK